MNYRIACPAITANGFKKKNQRKKMIDWFDLYVIYIRCIIIIINQ